MLEAYAVQLAALTTLAVAVLWSRTIDSLVVVAMHFLMLTHVEFLFTDVTILRIRKFQLARDDDQISLGKIILDLLLFNHSDV